MRVLLVGVGGMGIDYAHALARHGIEFTAVGRSEEGVARFRSATSFDAVGGGLANYLSSKPLLDIPVIVIVCVRNTQVRETVQVLLRDQSNGTLQVAGLLIEKPLGIDPQEASVIAEEIQTVGIRTFIAFNRRFYGVVRRLKEITEKDGGVEYVHCEFNEWDQRFIRASRNFSSNEIENWDFGNGCHVIDTALYIAGGIPVDFRSHTTRGNCLDMSNCPSKCVYGGSGVTSHGALITWKSYFRFKGPWMVEVVTSKKMKYKLSPLETLSRMDCSTGKWEVVMNSHREGNLRQGLSEMIAAFYSAVSRTCQDGEIPSGLVDISTYTMLLQRVYKTICSPARSNVVIVGGGNVAHRYIQGFSSVANAPFVFVIEPFALQQSKLVSKLGANHPSLTILDKSDTKWFPKQTAVVLSTTTADARFDSIMKVLADSTEVESVVLEKPTFQRLEHWDAFISEVSARQIKAFSTAGGCTMFSNLMNIVSGWRKTEKQPFTTVCVNGTNWGLCCNAVHYLAQFAILNGLRDGLDVSPTGPFILSGSFQGLKEAKRSGCFEVDAGTIQLFHRKSGSVVLTLRCKHEETGVQSSIEYRGADDVFVTYTPNSPTAVLVRQEETTVIEMDISLISQLGEHLLNETRQDTMNRPRLLTIQALSTFEKPLMSLFEQHFRKNGINTSRGVPIS
eukprot:CAMPEP_0179702552 /NCGR_PEP_ID=MMETSP0937-20121108/2335_1 /TAXON_ID=548131 ORGANISM="Ostreococcus mediterraneus, Strain clade-D-RCC2593" /NCGR_SAMPLE_ID=MMETSP0937 /ASSEMBLY_ACC=CAM_ASM_000575 /LENGTH=676 /DNA_ID=CAMNT_0021575687 /DNA_START=115 /DNA_END=2145 /DNA_ORIENTATION=-